MKSFRILPFFLVLLLCTGSAGCNLIGALVKTALPFAGLKVAFACIPEGTCVDTPAGPCAIGKVEAGQWITGFDGSPVQVLQKHAYLEDPRTPFLKVTFSDGAVVDLCRNHRIAGVAAHGVRAGQILAGRRVASVTSSAGVTRSYDLLTGDRGYRIQGVPVNSMIEEMHAAAAGLPAADSAYRAHAR